MPNAWEDEEGIFSVYLEYRKAFNLFFFFFVFFRAALWHMEVPRQGVQSELPLPAYTTATATPDASHICDLHHSSWHHRILNTLSEARDQTHILMDTSRVGYH